MVYLYCEKYFVEVNETMRDMQWYVYVEDINARRIKEYNIFEHYRFMEDIKQIYKKHKDDYDTFCEEVRRSLQYYFWSKCEWEIILSDWPPSDTFKELKVDVYDQVMLNKDVFMKYVWDMTHARKTSKRTKQ